MSIVYLINIFPSLSCEATKFVQENNDFLFVETDYHKSILDIFNLSSSDTCYVIFDYSISQKRREFILNTMKGSREPLVSVNSAITVDLVQYLKFNFELMKLGYTKEDFVDYNTNEVKLELKDNVVYLSKLPQDYLDSDSAGKILGLKELQDYYGQDKTERIYFNYKNKFFSSDVINQFDTLDALVNYEAIMEV